MPPLFFGLRGAALLAPEARPASETERSRPHSARQTATPFRSPFRHSIDRSLSQPPFEQGPTVSPHLNSDRRAVQFRRSNLSAVCLLSRPFPDRCQGQQSVPGRENHRTLHNNGRFFNPPRSAL